MAWRALLLEGWMRNHNFRADHPTVCADLAIRNRATYPHSDALLSSPTTVGRASQRKSQLVPSSRGHS
eukprot:1762117-Prymnesium_polylepis.1